MNAKKDDKGNWVCSECQTEDLNKMFLRTLGPQHPKYQAFIAAVICHYHPEYNKEMSSHSEYDPSTDFRRVDMRPM